MPHSRAMDHRESPARTVHEPSHSPLQAPSQSPSAVYEEHGALQVPRHLPGHAPMVPPAQVPMHSGRHSASAAPASTSR